MERAISEMEKIRRAEEIYSRRKNGNTSISLNKDEKIKNKSLYKILFQFLFLFNIAVIIVAVQNKDYIFTEDFLKQADKYNINLKTKVNEFITYINNNEPLIKDENNVNQTNTLNNTNQDNNVVNTVPVTNESIGKTEEIEEVSSLSQMDIDVNTIKSKYSMICPVLGTKTSGFGTREATEIVTSYHTGVDIANNKGTIIKSAITGKVTQVSSEGDYGKHLRITVDNLVTLYAHCDKIYVKEGDDVVQGQDIAEMGSTGNSTGNHLHFEIRYENRYIDPEKLIEI